MRKNNLIFFFLVIVSFSIATLFLPWGTFTAKQEFFGSIPVTTTGLNGSLTFSFIKMPHWLLVLITIISSLIYILNIQKIVQISKKIPVIMNIFVLLWLVLGVYFYLSIGSVQLGLVLTIFSTLSSLGLQLYTKNF